MPYNLWDIDNEWCCVKPVSADNGLLDPVGGEELDGVRVVGSLVLERRGEEIRVLTYHHNHLSWEGE